MVSDEQIGEWRRRTAAWWETPSTHCELCGRPLGRRAFVVSAQASERSFCGPDCAELAGGRAARTDESG
jgi:hypothetical protein